MATYHDAITEEQAELIRNASMFFVATADPNLATGPNGVGPVNLSPKGGVPLHLLSPNRVAYLDYTGSGNETARHGRAGGPITLMICSFAGEDAAVVRLYGTLRVTPLADSPLADMLLQADAKEKGPARQVIEVEVEKTITSCGYGVPVMKFVRHRRVDDRGRRYKDASASPTPVQV